MDVIPVYFAIAFTLHNLEEALYLPEWSRTAGIFHSVVSRRSFACAVIGVTILSYIITGAYMLTDGAVPIISYAYAGFVTMMIGNVFFPHLAATLLLGRYAPGTATGLLLNLPVGAYFLFLHSAQLSLVPLALAFICVTALYVAFIQASFRLYR